MSYGITVKDHRGTVIENADAITAATDSRVLTAGTSGTYTVPASTYIIAVAVSNLGDAMSVSLINSTTVQYSSTYATSGATLVITFL